MGFEKGNKKDGRHYWLTPVPIMEQLQQEFNFDFDPCPYPVPAGFDGLESDWGCCNYVNPPFGSYKDRRSGKRKGPTAWARKALKEYEKGKKVVLVYPMDRWIMMLLTAGATVRNLGDIKWLSIEDRLPGRGTGMDVAMFVLEPPGYQDNREFKRYTPAKEYQSIQSKLFSE
jgi:hypothetical protein